MKVNKFKYIILSCVGSLVLFSCNNLDQEPTDKYTDVTFWKSADNAESIVNMAYSQMYGAGKLWNDEGLSDNVIEGRDNNDGRMIRNGLADPSLGRFASEWKWGYEGIKTCHKFLENIDRVPKMSASLKEQRKAEIRFIRAFMHTGYLLAFSYLSGFDLSPAFKCPGYRKSQLYIEIFADR